MKIAYIHRTSQGYILVDSVARIARERGVMLPSIRMDYPDPKRGAKQMARARSQRKRIRKRMAGRRPFKIWFEKFYRSRQDAHIAAAALGCTHTQWRGRLSRCPTPKQLGIALKNGQIDQERLEQLVNPYQKEATRG